jgi:hypothetical protein
VNDLTKQYEGQKGIANFNLTSEQRKFYDDIAKGVGLSRSEVLRVVADLAKPISEEMIRLNELAQQKKLSPKQTKRAVSSMFRTIADRLDDRKR